MNDDLLVKYLTGDANERERRRVEDWRQHSEKNARHFRQMARIWTESRKLAPENTVDEDAAWERFRERVKQQEAAHHLPQVPYAKRWLRVAAVLALLVVAGWAVRYLLQEQGTPRMVKLASEREVREATLPDGSVVTLNKNSTLSYPRKFSGAERPVVLQGEAFFSIERDKDKPFIITVNDLKVQVTGTAFNVKSRDGITEVIVETGSVKVSRGKEEIALQPGEKTVSAEGEALIKEPARNTLYKYYRTKEFVCDGTPLQELASTLNEAYGTRIVIPDTALRQASITTVFQSDESLDQILKVISRTFDITVRYQGEQIILER